MRSTAATPLGLGPLAIRPPKVAEYGNLGLWDAIALGCFRSQRSEDDEHAGFYNYHSE